MVDREGALSMWTGDQDVVLTGQGERKQVGMAGRLRELDRPWRTVYCRFESAFWPLQVASMY